MAGQLVSLWIGDRLGRIERACLRSAVRQGHQVALYRYGPLDGAPDGVELRNAASVVPESRIVRHRTGSVSLFSNLFRYETQRRKLGTWIDCDAYLLKPLDLQAAYLFGLEAPGIVNGGVLRIPADAPMLATLIELFAERSVPYWLPLRSRVAALVRLARTGRSGLAAMPWGTTGPKALTALISDHGLALHALPQDVLYPVEWQDADWIRDPDRAIETMITSRTVSIHLWNERIKSFKEQPAPRGSFLARLQHEGE